MNPLLKTYYLLRDLGPRVLWLRAGVYFDHWRGTLPKIFRPRPWSQIALGEIMQPGTPTDPVAYVAFKRQQNIPFLFPMGRPPKPPEYILRSPQERKPSFAERLRLLEEMKPVYFFNHPSPTPVDWYVNPIEDKRSDPTRPWYETIDFSPEQGDMRLMWEPARAAWALDAARARAHGFDVNTGELFWRMLDSWIKDCPPFMGFQWRCGQESSVRFIAVAIAAWALADDPAMTPPRWEQLAKIAWATGHRVAHHMHYAVSQKNNHALSEACGLMLIAHLFPELRDAHSWWDTGKNVMAREIRRQVYDDGSYVQSSVNYERVMLHVTMLAMRLAELAGRPFERDIYERIDRCGEFMFQLMEPSTGRLPMYGHNDGACVLPLSECDFTDFRPVIQATHYLIHHRRLFPPGPWDEELLWLFGPESIDSPVEPSRRPVSSRFDAGGYFTLRGRQSWMMTRCHTFRDRIHQIDPLHVDLWWRGQNLLQDAGTYHYYTPEDPRIEHYFKSIAAHNTVEIDDQDPLVLVSRFLWLPWPKARILHYEASPERGLYFEGESGAYARAPWQVLHRRAILGLPDDHWVIVDELNGSNSHKATLRWHMLDVSYTWNETSRSIKLDTPAGEISLCVDFMGNSGPQSCRIVRGVKDEPRVQGFASTYYGEYHPVPVLEFTASGGLPMRFLTFIAPGSAANIEHLAIDPNGGRFRLVGGRTFELELSPAGASGERMIAGWHGC